jgi:hypothetical protein
MKRWVVFVTLALVLATAGCGMISTGESAAERATQIAEFDVPEGFSPIVGMDLAGVTMVGYNSADEDSHIFLIQAAESAAMDQEQLEASLQQAMASSDQTVTTTTVEEVPLTIRGEEVTATIGTGTSRGGEGPTMRVLTVPFTGNGGPALLLYQAPDAEWDQAAVDAFIASFR